MNSYGTKFRLSIFGESHGPLIGVVLDGVPAGMPLSREDFLADLDRRRSGAKGSTPRKESDLPEIVSGVCDGHTTGAPLTIVFRNSNTRSGDYSDFRATPRPGHADFVAERKYRAFNDLRGGGHFSGRLTLTLVAAGVVAKKMIGPIEIRARITELGGIPRERLNCEPGKELGAVGARAHRQMQVGALGSAGAVGIDHHQLGAALLGGHRVGHHIDLRVDRISAPDHDQIRVLARLAQIDPPLGAGAGDPAVVGQRHADRRIPA